MRYIAALFALTGALSHCSAAPAVSGLSPREDSPAWPKMLGPNDPPKMPDVDAAHATIMDSGKEYSFLKNRDSLGWWTAVLEIAKLHPDGNWVKSMFENANEEKGTVDVVLFKDLKPYKSTIPTKFTVHSDEGKAIWPLLLELAAFYVSNPEGDSDDKDPKDLSIGYLVPQIALETLTGHKTVRVQPDNANDLKRLISYSHVNPTIVEVVTENGVRDAAVMNFDDEGFTYYTYADDGKKIEDVAKYEKLDLTNEQWPFVVQLENFKGFGGRPGGEPQAAHVYDRELILIETVADQPSSETDAVLNPTATAGPSG